MKLYSKNERILNLYTRFCEGKTISKSEEAERFGVDERSVQRDIDDIRAFLAERATSGMIQEPLNTVVLKSVIQW